MRPLHLLILAVGVLALWPAVAQATEEPGEELPTADYPAWSPDGRHIAFQSDHAGDNWDIWLIHPDGSGLQRLTAGTSQHERPQWTSDPYAVFFVRRQDAHAALRKKVLAGGPETQVLQSASSECAVSHTGQEVIVGVQRDDSYGLIIVSAATDAELRWLADGLPGSAATAPTWSPDDQEAAFRRSGALWARNAADRSNLRRVADFSGQDRLVGKPNWGPAGFIAFDSEERLYKVRPDGTDLTCIFTDPNGCWAMNPSWSPDGAKLVFARLLDQSYELWTINADGTGLTQLTHTVATPTLNPDGGGYSAPQTVTMACSTAGATIRYTTDGTEPTEDSPVYSTPVSVDHTMTLKAKAWKTDRFAGQTKTAAHTFPDP